MRAGAAAGAIVFVLANASTGFAQTDIRSKLSSAPARGLFATKNGDTQLLACGGNGGTQLFAKTNRQKVECPRFSPREHNRQTAPSRLRQHRGISARQAIGILIGGFAGFYVGGQLGAAIEGDSCRCDDPGLKGFFIGAPLGAIGGGILGAFVTQ